MHLLAEFDRQVENLFTKGYPAAAGLSEAAFLGHLSPLKEKLVQLSFKDDAKEGYLPFVIVITTRLVSTEKAMEMIDFHGHPGGISMTPAQPTDFSPIDSVKLPTSSAYLLIDIDRGGETLNIAPEEAFKTIAIQHRSPLTIDEGVAIVTQFPDFLKKNNCFSLLASRRGDKRVPALWISNGQPKLGWCWNGNPHTWLGSASAKERIGA
jgi:hypothetical protein